MKVLNILFLGGIAVGSALLCSCSDDDETLTPGMSIPNFFEVPENDNSEEAQIKRSFYNNTGIYLLFNDTLATYTDSHGTERIETVDFGWSLTASTTQTVRFEYFDDDSRKKEIADKIERFFVPYLDVEGSAMRPYSILLFKNIESYNSYSYRWKAIDYLSCIRCFGVNASSWVDIDDAVAKTTGKYLLRKLVDEKINSSDPLLDEFYAISNEYYDSSPYEAFPDWEYEQDITLVYKIGFLTYYPDSWGDIEWDSFPYDSTDFRLFKDAIFNESETDFREKWADYPLIIQKYELLKKVIESLGINLNAVE